MAQFQIECVESNTQENRSQYSKFILEPLDRGQGTTVGNALRRVLLSNLEGTAVTAVRIAEVSHKFATIPGVREDVLEILMRMKEVVLKSYSPQSQVGRLLITGPATVTAAHFDLPSEVEIIDLNQYVATLAEGAKLDMEFWIERGRGYRTVDQGQEEDTTLDLLQIDAVFMPVRKVNYSVEDAWVDGSTHKDRLLLEIWTNGSLTPKEALSSAASILMELFNPLKDISLEPADPSIDLPEDPTSQIPIEELQLSVRAYNCLKRAQVNSVADLLDYTQEDLSEIKNFGQKSAEEVIKALQRRLGITLPCEKSIRDVSALSCNPSESAITVIKYQELNILDTMSDEVKAQIQRLDDTTAQIFSWIQSELKRVSEERSQFFSQSEQMNQEKTKLQSQLTEAQAQLKKFNQEQSQSHSRLDRLTWEHSQCQSELERNKAELEELSDQCEQLESKLNKANQEKAVIASQTKALQQNKEQLQSQLSRTQDTLNKISRNEAVLSSQMNALSQEKDRLQLELEQAQNDLAKVNQDKNEFISQLDAVRCEQSQLQEQLRQSKNQTSRLQAKFDQAQNQLSSATEEKAQLLSLSQQASEERARLQEEQRELRDGLNRANEAQAILQLQLAEHSQLVGEANQQVEALTRDLSPCLQTLTERLDTFISGNLPPEAQALLSQLRVQLSEVQDRMQQIQPVAVPLLENLRQERSHLQAQLSVTQTQLEQTSQERISFQTELDSTKNQLSQTQQTRFQIETQLSATQSQLERIGQEQTSLQAELSSAVEQSNQRQQNLEQSNQERSQLQRQLFETNGQLQQSQQKLHQIQQELEESQQQQLPLHNQLSHAEGQCQQYQQQLQQAQEKQLQLQSQLSVAEERLRQVQQESQPTQQKSIWFNRRNKRGSNKSS